MRKHTNELVQTIKQHKILSSILLILIIYVLFNFFQQGLVYSFLTNDIETIQSSIVDLGMFGSFAYVLLIIVEVIAAPIPSIILYSIGGILFGGFWAAILTFIGNIIGSSLAYLIARTYFKKYIETKISPKITHKFNDYIEKHGEKSIFLLRVNPITSSDIVSYLAGLTKMKFIPFIISTSLGLLPLILIQTYFGSEVLLSNPIFLLLFVIVTVVYILIVIILIIRSFSLKK